MIDEADRDNDGEIGEDEFIRIMKKTNLFWKVSKLPMVNNNIIVYKIFTDKLNNYKH